ncbi:transglutaminase family protein [Aquimarina sp. I32.4]|uniref:transglutaminase-like domain-containing protein n=1 Tax=Aquimarina sp. I32.4 TaxID=2053903 RepID=UPI000CDEA8A0|nr:transglutaminase-like domain-containing protein [Aquimarina sp. I32.4]
MDYLASSYFFDFDSDEIQNLITEFKTDSLSDKEKTKRLYIKVRDSWRYDPYNFRLSKENFKASKITLKAKGHCIEKSIILIACLRALKIPARLHLGKVKNHIGVEKLTKKFGTNELTPHGMVNVYLNNKWLKLSPAFNKSMCKICNVSPLEFDGENNSFLQEFNNQGNLFMEYLDDYGHFEDVPLEFIRNNVKAHYPHFFDNKGNVIKFKL